ncbi:hypothetical protein PR202_ga18184 [Eleusine coracana subsp. coracana]|uniref:Pentatricopeptide repeat-containing protein n=1 Tax=Eleusine coracana subsp. coracana TaxID=191504 RepID=A0AAV5CSW8_ELECO|nr:hypothetical protein PR202_ga18184 [Eleusine coracana subsp. coracana]
MKLAWRLALGPRARPSATIPSSSRTAAPAAALACATRGAAARCAFRDRLHGPRVTRLRRDHFRQQAYGPAPPGGEARRRAGGVRRNAASGRRVLELAHGRARTGRGARQGGGSVSRAEATRVPPGLHLVLDRAVGVRADGDSGAGEVRPWVGPQGRILGEHVRGLVPDHDVRQLRGVRLPGACARRRRQPERGVVERSRVGPRDEPSGGGCLQGVRPDAGAQRLSWTAMIKGYVMACEMGWAFELFNLMPAKNSVSWCVMIGGFVSHERFGEAVELFRTLMRNGEEVTGAILVKIVNAYASLKSIGGGRCIHGFAVKAGFVHDQIIEASLVSMYCKSLDVNKARLEFEKMDRKHVCSWNAIISGYLHTDRIYEARKLFDSMIERDKVSWNLMVSGYIKGGIIADATELYFKMPEKNLEATTTLMACFIDNGMLDKARDVFYNMPQVDVMSCTTLLFGYVKGGYLDDAEVLFHRMHKRTAVTYNVMIAGLLHQGKVTEAYKLFNESPERDVVSWSCLITGLCQNGLSNEALKLYKEMLLSNIRPTESVISSLISCFSHNSMVVHGQQFHATSIRLGLESHLLIQNSLISIYCKCGEMIFAQAIFDRMSTRDVVTWNTMIHGHALNSLGQNAIGMFEDMKEAQVDPDDITFLGVLTACNHMSLLEEAKHFFNVMTHK